MSRREPLRMTVAAAAEMLSLRPDTVRRLVRRGVLGNLVPERERGRRRPVYLHPDEIAAFAYGGAAAAKAFRLAHPRIYPGERKTSG